MRTRFRRKRKSNIRWLIDNSAFAQVSGYSLGSPTANNGGTIELLPHGVFDAPFQQAGETAGFVSPVARMGPLDNLIISRITGKVAWAIERNSGGTGATDASGDWLFTIRQAIVMVPRSTAQLTGGFAGQVTTLGVGVETLQDPNFLLDPGDTYDTVQQGSLTTDGLRYIWRRMWLVPVSFGTGGAVPQGPMSSEVCAPPAGYVDIKPKRLLRAQDSMFLVTHVQALPGAGADGTARVWVGPDLRIAGHNTTRRR